MPSELNVPRETLDLIIDELHTDNDALLLCSKVSTSFQASCRRHFFAKVLIHGESSCERFAEFLASHPEILPYIRKFHLRDNGWGHTSTALASVLRVLADSRTLQIFHFRNNDLRMSAPRWPFPHVTIIKDLFASPRLDCITMDYYPLCAFPMELLSVTPSLRHLKFIGNCQIRPCDISSRCMHGYITDNEFLESLDARSRNSNRLRYKDDPSLFPSPPHLLSLYVEVHHWDRLVDHLWPTLQRLRSLRINTERIYEPPVFWELLEFCSETLVSLRWDDSLANYRYQDNPPIGNHRLPPHLRLLVLQFCEITFACSQLASIAKIRLPCSIEHIAVVLPTFYHKEDTVGAYEVDEILSRLVLNGGERPLPSVRGVHLMRISFQRELILKDRLFPRVKHTGLMRIVEGSEEDIETALEHLGNDVQSGGWGNVIS